MGRALVNTTPRRTYNYEWMKKYGFPQSYIEQEHYPVPALKVPGFVTSQSDSFSPYDSTVKEEATKQDLLSKKALYDLHQSNPRTGDKIGTRKTPAIPPSMGFMSGSPAYQSDPNLSESFHYPHIGADLGSSSLKLAKTLKSPGLVNKIGKAFKSPAAAGEAMMDVGGITRSAKSVIHGSKDAMHAEHMIADFAEGSKRKGYFNGLLPGQENQQTDNKKYPDVGTNVDMMTKNKIKIGMTTGIKGGAEPNPFGQIDLSKPLKKNPAMQTGFGVHGNKDAVGGYVDLHGTTKKGLNVKVKAFANQPLQQTPLIGGRQGRDYFNEFTPPNNNYVGDENTNTEAIPQKDGTMRYKNGSNKKRVIYTPDTIDEQLEKAGIPESAVRRGRDTGEYKGKFKRTFFENVKVRKGKLIPLGDVLSEEETDPTATPDSTTKTDPTTSTPASQTPAGSTGKIKWPGSSGVQFGGKSSKDYGFRGRSQYGIKFSPQTSEGNPLENIGKAMSGRTSLPSLPKVYQDDKVTNWKDIDDKTLMDAWRERKIHHSYRKKPGEFVEYDFTLGTIDDIAKELKRRGYELGMGKDWGGTWKKDEPSWQRKIQWFMSGAGLFPKYELPLRDPGQEEDKKKAK